MPQLSLTMIVRDEEAFLGHCLDSVQGLVDEIVVVDTGSRDATPDLARARGARVLFRAWDDDFAAARNHALEACTGEWVLILDADEAVDRMDHPRIREACAQDRISAFHLSLRNYFISGTATALDNPARRNDTPYLEGRDFPFFSDHPGLRLCRRLPGLAYRGRIHEILEPFFLERGLRVEPLEAVIHHYGKTLGARERFKATYYLELARKDAAEHPSDHQRQFNLLQQALVAEAWPLALEAAREYLARVPGPPHPLGHFGAALALQGLDRHAEALKHLDALLRADPRHAAALTRKGVSLALLGRRREARAAFGTAARVGPGFTNSYVNLSELCLQEGKSEEAEAVLRRALEAYPEDPSLWTALLKVSMHRQDLVRCARDASEALRACPEGGGGLWHHLAALGHLQAGHPGHARAMVEAGLQRHPEHPELSGLLHRLRTP